MYMQRKKRLRRLSKILIFPNCVFLVAKFSSVWYLISMFLFKTLVQERPNMTWKFFFFLLWTKMFSNLTPHSWVCWQLKALWKWWRLLFLSILKSLLFLEIFTFLSWRFSYIEKRFDTKVEVVFKIYEVKDWTTNNYNIQTAKYIQK